MPALATGKGVRRCTLNDPVMSCLRMCAPVDYFWACGEFRPVPIRVAAHRNQVFAAHPPTGLVGDGGEPSVRFGVAADNAVGIRYHRQTRCPPAVRGYGRHRYSAGWGGVRLQVAQAPPRHKLRRPMEANVKPFWITSAAGVTAAFLTVLIAMWPALQGAKRI